MSMSFFGLDIAITGMAANQKALEVTGHNVSNLGTPGFSRQSAILVGAPTRSYGNWKVEMGVDVQEIRQIRDIFQDGIVRTASNALGYWETRADIVNDLQTIMAEPIKDGLQVSLNKFWDSWQELSKAPESLSIRSLVRQRSESVVEYINHMGTQLNKLQTDLNTEIYRRVDDVNVITKKIAELNIKITSAEVGSNKPNDYYDERNLLVDKLSKLVQAETFVGQDGNMDVIVGGYFLVNKAIQSDLIAASNEDYSEFYTPKIRINSTTVANVNVGQGVIKGLLEGRGEVSGATGSYANGTPNTTAEIVFAVDVSDTSAANLASFQANVNTMLTDIKNRGLDYGLRLVAFDGTGVLSNVAFGKNDAGFLAGVAGLSSTASTSSDFGALVTSMAATPAGGPEANRFMMVFTGESINGDGAVTTGPVMSGYINTLNNANIKTSVVTSPTYFTAGDPTEPGWSVLTNATQGMTYDIGSTDYTALMMKLSSDVNTKVNEGIVTVSAGSNILSSVRKQLNALINIMAREVNKLHASGVDLRGNAGGPLFEAINNTRPMEMGNIRVSSAMKDINSLVAGEVDANGDNRIAQKIANLRNLSLMTGKERTLSIDTYYQNIIMDVGNKGYDAETITENQRQLVLQADNIRQSVMGVSMDEEMAAMIRFKYAYNASSKTISVVDEMIDTIINRMFA